MINNIRIKLENNKTTGSCSAKMNEKNLLVGNRYIYLSQQTYNSIKIIDYHEIIITKINL